jgi:hypothetical protein
MLKASAVRLDNPKGVASRRPSAATAPGPQLRRLSQTPVPARAAADESDSDEEQWQRAKATLSRAGQAKPTVGPGSRRPSLQTQPSSRAPMATKAGGKEPAAAESDSDDELWTRMKASYVPAGAPASAPRSSRPNVPTRTPRASRGLAQTTATKEESDSDEEQWQRLKAQVYSAPRPSSSALHLPTH